MAFQSLRRLLNELAFILFLFSIPSKILETVVLSSVKESWIKQYGSNQFGSRPRSSTLLAHITIDVYVTRQLYSPSTLRVVLITFDMRKVFDSLFHSNLLQYNTEGSVLSDFISWRKGFLHSRKQKVLLNGELSSSDCQYYSVPICLPHGVFISQLYTLQKCQIRRWCNICKSLKAWRLHQNNYWIWNYLHEILMFQS